MRGLLLAALVAAAGCKPRCEPSPEIPADGIDQDCDGEDASGRFFVSQTLTGPPDLGFGHAVGFFGSEIAVGAPLGQTPGVWVDGEQVLQGPADSFTGSAVGELVSSPRAGFGQVLSAEGAILWEGTGPTPGGGAPVQTERGIASLHPDGVRIGSAFTATEGRPVSLLAADLGAGEQVVAGLLTGGLWIEGQSVSDGREVGRSLAACDLDGDGDRDLAVGVPSRDEVWLFAVDDALDLATAEPVVLRPEPGRGGHALACGPAGLAVGSPQAAGGAGWVGLYQSPLNHDVAVATHVGRGREALGFALAMGEQLVVGGPGEGRVLVLALP